MSRTGRFVKRQVWIWPIVAVVVLALVGVGVRRAIETTMKENLRSQLATLLGAETAMLEEWLDEKQQTAEAAANAAGFRHSVYPLLGVEQTPETPEAAEVETLRKALDRTLGPEMAARGLTGYFVADRQTQIVASSYPMLVGQQHVPQYERFLARVLDDKSVVSTPFPFAVMMRDASGALRTGVPTMYACASIRDADFRVVGALALQLRPEGEFTEILQLGRMGESGETYAFDRNGVMVSNSRFDDALILLGTLPDQPDVRSILNVQIRDPGVDMTACYRPRQRRSKLPLTKMAANAVGGGAGVDVDGYRDYRGVPVVGAWTWLPTRELGVATEIDASEAFRPLNILRRMFCALYAVLVVCAIVILVFTIVLARLRRKAATAAIQARRLGQYTLEEKFGEGAMGVVYKGRDAMLRRPTAIKMLDVEKMNEDAIQRFEHEVQITCQLNHPSTVVIYDFGLVKEIDRGSAGGGGSAGTPLYMSPEAIETPTAVDHRSDLYSVGAVGYFMLTGQLVFDAASLVELCQKHVDEIPVPPSQRVGRELCSELEYAILSCSEKKRAKRPQTARDLAKLLKRCPEAGTWTVDDADTWWSEHERKTARAAAASVEETTESPTGYDQTLAAPP